MHSSISLTSHHIYCIVFYPIYVQYTCVTIKHQILRVDRSVTRRAVKSHSSFLLLHCSLFSPRGLDSANTHFINSFLFARNIIWKIPRWFSDFTVIACRTDFLRCESLLLCIFHVEMFQESVLELCPRPRKFSGQFVQPSDIPLFYDRCDQETVLFYVWATESCLFVYTLTHFDCAVWGFVLSDMWVEAVAENIP